MVKRFCALLSVLLLAALLLPVGALADGGLRIEQVQIEMPEVRAFVADGGGDIPDGVEASLGGRRLELEEIRRYDPALDATSYFFLVDCSTSTTWGQMEAVKAALAGFAQNLDEGATVTLITFGVGVEVVLQRETNPDAIAAAAAALAADQPGTVFFDALAKAIDLSSEQPYALERKLAFVFSDSVDYNLGGHTKEEIDKMLAATGLPFYALGFETGTKEGLDNFGAVARASGGAISVVSEHSLGDAFNGMLAETRNVLVARFAAGTNVIDAPVQEFSLAAGGGKTAAMDVPVRYWKADTEAPRVEAVEQHTEESIRLRFSKPVQGANLAESYVVKSKNGDLVGIRAAAYDDGENAVTLTFANSPPGGEYTLTCPGVTDLSMEKNKVAESTDFLFEGAAAPAPAPAADEGMPVGFWIFVGVLALAIIVGVAIVATRKRKTAAAAELPADAPGAPAPKGFAEVDQPLPAGGEMQVHFRQTDAPLPKIRLHVTGPSGAGRPVEVPVNKTLFVGRSDICDVYFDDTSMSRQHFVIGEENGVFTLTNLSETGGTTLNGVKIANPRPLKDGDTIGAGRQSIVFFAAGVSGVQ